MVVLASTSSDFALTELIEVLIGDGSFETHGALHKLWLSDDAAHADLGLATPVDLSTLLLCLSLLVSSSGWKDVEGYQSDKKKKNYARRSLFFKYQCCLLSAKPKCGATRSLQPLWRLLQLHCDSGRGADNGHRGHAGKGVGNGAGRLGLQKVGGQH